MASNISLLVHRPVIPMMRSKQEKDLRETTITNTIIHRGLLLQGITFMNHVEYRRLDVFVSQDGDVETHIRLIDAFLNNTGTESLNAQNDQNFTLICKGVAEATLDQFDRLTQAHGPGRTINDLRQVLNRQLYEMTGGTAFYDQKLYMENCTKSHKISVQDLWARFQMVNKFSSHLPGSEGVCLCPNDQRMKIGFFGMMLPQWKQRFALNGSNELSDPTHTVQRLIGFMQTQEAEMNGLTNQGRIPRSPRRTPGRARRPPHSPCRNPHNDPPRCPPLLRGRELQ